MSTAGDAVASSVARRRAVSALARAPSIPRRRAAEPIVSKRAALVLRRGMRPLEFRQIEEQLEGLGLNVLPVVAGQRKLQVADTPVCGLIITGSDIDVSPIERDMIEQAVREVIARERPVLAMSDAAKLVLAATGLEAPKETGLALFVHNGVRVLTTQAQVQDALKQVAKCTEG